MKTDFLNSGLNGAPNSRVGDVTREADRSPGFSLIEIMVVVALLSIIILGLLAMFNETQLAFRTSMTQTDVLEAGRMFTDLAGREMEQMTPSYSGSNSVYNFYSTPPNNLLPNQPTVGLPGMPGGKPFLRTNVMSDDVYFLTRQNQTWSGIGYFVRSNAVYGNVPAPVGTLYRWTTNASTVRFAQNPGALWSTFNNVCNRANASANLSALGISKIMDGVVHFSVRAYDLNGNWINPLELNTGASHHPLQHFLPLPQFRAKWNTPFAATPFPPTWTWNWACSRTGHSSIIRHCRRARRRTRT